MSEHEPVLWEAHYVSRILPLSHRWEEGCPPPLGALASGLGSSKLLWAQGPDVEGRPRNKLAGSLTPETLENTHLLFGGTGDRERLEAWSLLLSCLIK